MKAYDFIELFLRGKRVAAKELLDGGRSSASAHQEVEVVALVEQVAGVRREMSRTQVTEWRIAEGAHRRWAERWTHRTGDVLLRLCELALLEKLYHILDFKSYFKNQFKLKPELEKSTTMNFYF